MWTCPTCGTANPDGLGCRSCALTRDGGPVTSTEPVEEGDLIPPEVLARKIRQTRFLRNPRRDWVRRGALLGWLVGCAFSLGVIVLGLYRRLTTPPPAPQVDFSLTFFALVVVTFVLLPTLFAAGAAVAWDVFRPVFVALFFSPDHFEKDYGPAEKQSGRQHGKGR